MRPFCETCRDDPRRHKARHRAYQQSLGLQPEALDNAVAVHIDNNWAENKIRPWASGRKHWFFAGSLRSGKRAAVIICLIQSERLHEHDPYAYLKDVLTRLPTQRVSEIMELLPRR